MTVVFGRAFVEDERQRADTLRNQPHGTVDDGFPCITFWKSVAVGRKKSAGISRREKPDAGQDNQALVST